MTALTDPPGALLVVALTRAIQELDHHEKELVALAGDPTVAASIRKVRDEMAGLRNLCQWLSDDRASRRPAASRGGRT
jgi:hypothetical protein